MKLNSKLFITILLIGVYAVSPDPYSPLSYTDRPCGSSLTNLWLDVVVVVDTSAGVGNSGLASIAANIAASFGSGIRIGTDPKEPRTTRVALVSYDTKATIRADLNKYQSVDDLYSGLFGDLDRVSTSYDAYLELGLAAAANVLQNGTHDGTNRTNYQQVVLVYASTYQGSGPLQILPVAMRMKAAGVKIVTVAYVEDGDINLGEKLAKVASPRMNFTSTQQKSIVTSVQNAMLEANCFCPYHFIQFRDTYADDYSLPYGVCIQPVGLNAVWRAAKLSCANNYPNSYLINEYTATKHEFILNAIKPYDGFVQPYTYHTGLSMINGNWTWDQPNGWVQPQLQKWANWGRGYPMLSSSMGAVVNEQSGPHAFWRNVGFYNTAANFVCEIYACDTDNYCAPGAVDN